MSRILAAVLALILAAQDSMPSKRVSGPVKIDGLPDVGGDFGFEVAFPRLRFSRPLYIAHPNDGTDRLFVLEQDGVIHSFDNRADAPGTEVALDIRSKVYRRHNEEGLLGMAFHPDFKRNRFVFLHYSANPPRRGVISRFKMDAAGRKIDPKSERVILEQEQPYGNHNGGMIEFGPDGYLYISFGDGGAANDPHGHGQNRRTWLAAMLRIDVDKGSPYSVPPDNPFVKDANSRPEIWAYGLRNIWRFSFDRVTGECWGGDVGQDRYEEIDILKRGGNYGWNVREGKQPFGRGGGGGGGPFEEPVIDFNRSEARSITGGYVYRGKKLPGLYGAYLYADYETGNVWALRWDGRKVVENKLLGRGRNISSFGEDRDGEVYFCSFDGQIYRFVERGGGSSGAKFPIRLSETGLFTDVKKLATHASLIPYTVNVPLWSDGADKRRWLMLPGMEKVRVSADGAFEFPRGTIFVKHFELGGRRLETRLLIHSDRGWAGYTYVWDDQEKDAYLIDSRIDKPIAVEVNRRRVDRTWTFPSRSDCMSCHTQAAGFVLGFHTAQLNRAGQLEAMGKLGVFEGTAPGKDAPAFPEWGDAKADVERAARAYLDANCAMCHQPTGPGNAKIDLRWTTPLDRAGLLNEEPGQGDLGVRGAAIVKPGAPDKSVLPLRMKRTDAQGMPNLSHNLVDEEAVKLIERWIKGLK
jgi:uncharacterized repeat protein (TIGR03806 family)